MPKRPRSARPPRNSLDQEGFIPKPPPRKSFEKTIPDSIPEPGQRLMPPRPRPRGQFDDFASLLQRPEPPCPPAPDARPVRPRPDRFDAIARGPDASQTASEPRGNGNQLIVPMVCAAINKPFAARFQRTYITDRWRFAEAFLVGDGAGPSAPKGMMVPVNEMNWSGAMCPGCGKSCGPILCECGRLGCDGGVSFVAPLRRMYRCSCGAMGFLEPNLKEVSGAKGVRAQEAQKADASSSTWLALRLPRPE